MKRLGLGFFFPIRCLGCGRYGNYLCPECLSGVALFPNSFCLFCGRITKDGETCPVCEGKYFLDRCLSLAFFSEPLIRQAIQSMKYKSGFLISRDLAQALLRVEAVADLLKGDFSRSLLVPIPMHKRKERRRGFNQAVLIARTLAQLTGIAYCENLLLKVIQREAQMKVKERRQRWQNAAEVFEFNWKRRDLIGHYQRIILVDDVATTGATLNEAARCLGRAGFLSIQAITVARQVNRIEDVLIKKV